jgi:hypothetical protein
VGRKKHDVVIGQPNETERILFCHLLTPIFAGFTPGKLTMWFQNIVTG